MDERDWGFRNDFRYVRFPHGMVIEGECNAKAVQGRVLEQTFTAMPQMSQRTFLFAAEDNGKITSVSLLCMQEGKGIYEKPRAFVEFFLYPKEGLTEITLYNPFYPDITEPIAVLKHDAENKTELRLVPKPAIVQLAPFFFKTENEANIAVKYYVSSLLALPDLEEKLTAFVSPALFFSYEYISGKYDEQLYQRMAGQCWSQLTEYIKQLYPLPEKQEQVLRFLERVGISIQMVAFQKERLINNLPSALTNTQIATLITSSLIKLNEQTQYPSLSLLFDDHVPKGYQIVAANKKPDNRYMSLANGQVDIDRFTYNISHFEDNQVIISFVVNRYTPGYSLRFFEPDWEKVRAVLEDPKADYADIPMQIARMTLWNLLDKSYADSANSVPVFPAQQPGDTG